MKGSAVIWPAYLDANKSRRDGRKISQRDAVRSPSVDEIAEAARSLGLGVDVEHQKSYPRSHWERSGRAIITITGSAASKTHLLRMIASEIKKRRREIEARAKRREKKKGKRLKG